MRALRRKELRVLSAVCIVGGILLVLSPWVWATYTGQAVGETQTEALASWERASVRGQVAPGPEQASFPSGMVLTIPSLGLRRFVPEGATSDHLRRFGVGRITWTALPHANGTVGIAGHRTTHGAPFFRLDRLEQGDAILVDFQGRRYTYRVDRFELVRPTRVDVLQDRPDRRTIALVTCTPVYSAAYRLVVLASLDTITPLGTQ